MNVYAHPSRITDLHRENMKKKRRELEQASLDAASDLLDTDSNATFAMVMTKFSTFIPHLKWLRISNLHCFCVQKPLVRHPGDPLALEKLRQCEIHMAPPKRPNCCRTWLSKFPTR